MRDQGAALDAGHGTGRRLQTLELGDNGRMSKKPAHDKAKTKAKTGPAQRTIALNKRARYEYHLVERFEAGLALQGWEVKAIRAGRANLTDGYAYVQDGEIHLIGAQITPLIQASTHVVANDRRTRKLLLHRHEIDKLLGRVERDGYTLVPTAMYWSGNKVKLEIALAKGKKEHDKRDTARERDWQREKQRVMRRHNKDA